MAAELEQGHLLLVKNLPTALPTNAIDTLLKHVGALHVRVLSNRNKKSAIAKFLDERTRMMAINRLNKMRLADQQLVASVYKEEKPTKETEIVIEESKETQQHAAATMKIFPPLPPLPPIPPASASTWKQPEPLAPHLGLYYPPSPLLEYKYPKPNSDIILNIANALVALPKFYTQVLHLMNKMNLPPPFEPNTIPGQFHSLSNEVIQRKRRREGEFIASDDEDDVKNDDVHTPMPTITEEVIAIPNQTTSKTPTTKKPIKFLRKTVPIVNIFHSDESNRNKLIPRPGVITESELSRTRLPPQELNQNKYMQGYEIGEATAVLYVKNIAKSLDESDLRYLFGCVFPDDTSMEALSIRLFREGRLKGQAFVSFPTIELATLALELVHGVIMDEKPLIVCYRKQATQQQQSTSIT